MRRGVKPPHRRALYPGWRRWSSAKLRGRRAATRGGMFAHRLLRPPKVGNRFRRGPVTPSKGVREWRRPRREGEHAKPPLELPDVPEDPDEGEEARGALGPEDPPRSRGPCPATRPGVERWRPSAKRGTFDLEPKSAPPRSQEACQYHIPKVLRVRAAQAKGRRKRPRARVASAGALPGLAPRMDPTPLRTLPAGAARRLRSGVRVAHPRGQGSSARSLGALRARRSRSSLRTHQPQAPAKLLRAREFSCAQERVVGEKGPLAPAGRRWDPRPPPGPPRSASRRAPAYRAEGSCSQVCDITDECDSTPALPCGPTAHDALRRRRVESVSRWRSALPPPSPPASRRRARTFARGARRAHGAAFGWGAVRLSRRGVGWPFLPGCNLMLQGDAAKCGSGGKTTA